MSDLHQIWCVGRVHQLKRKIRQNPVLLIHYSSKMVGLLIVGETTKVSATTTFPKETRCNWADCRLDETLDYTPRTLMARRHNRQSMVDVLDGTTTSLLLNR